MSLETWVMVLDWRFLDRFEVGEFLDKMGEASVTHLAFAGAPPVRPDPKCYADSPIGGVDPPPDVLAREQVVRSLFRQATDRGIGVYIYGTNPHMGGVPEAYSRLPCKHVIDVDGGTAAVDSYWGACANGRQFLPYYLGRIADTYQNFPEIKGFLNDGPEFGYEISPGLMGDNWSLFSCFGPCCAATAASLGYDFGALKRSALTLARGLRSLDVDLLQHTIDSGSNHCGVLAAIAAEPGVREWLDFRRDSITAYTRQLCAGVKSLNGVLQVGVGSRLPAFTPLTGSDLTALAAHADFLLPKIYLWMDGYDGLYGTVYRWAKTLVDWNPHLSESLVVQFVNTLFGFSLPGVDRPADMLRHVEATRPEATEADEVVRVARAGEPFPEQFFTGVVVDQVEEMIRQVGDPARVCPWVCTSHGGRVLSPHELDLLLSAAGTAGLAKYLNFCSLADEDWAIAVKHG